MRIILDHLEINNSIIYNPSYNYLQSCQKISYGISRKIPFKILYPVFWSVVEQYKERCPPSKERNLQNTRL